MGRRGPVLPLGLGDLDLPATLLKDQNYTMTSGTNVNPRTQWNLDSTPGRRYWRPAGSPYVEVLERRETLPFRGYSDLYAFAFQAASVPTRFHYRGRLHDVPPGAVILREPGETFGFADPSSVIILLISPVGITPGVYAKASD